MISQQHRGITCLPSGVAHKHVIATKDYVCCCHVSARDQKMEVSVWFHQYAKSVFLFSLIPSAFLSPSCRERPDRNISQAFPLQASLKRQKTSVSGKHQK